MGDTPSRTAKCRTPDQWVDVEYHYDDLEQTPVANMPFEVVCVRDRSIRVRGTTDASGKARASGLIPGPVEVEFQPDSDAEARQQADQLRKDFRQSLDAIVTGIQQQAVYQDQVLAEMNLVEKGVVYAGAFSQGVWDGVTEFADFVQQVAPMLVQLGVEYLDLQRAILEGDINALEQKMRAAKARGEEIAAATQETFETLFLLLSDPEIRSVLKSFPQRYWDAHSSVEQARLAGSLGSDLVVALLLGAVTGGAGAAAVTAKIGARGGALATKAMGQLADLAKAMKKIKPKLKFDGQTQGTVQGKVPRNRSNNPLNSGHGADSDQSGTNGNGARCDTIKKTCTEGEPISMITGEELLQQTDFVIPGLIPLPWTRTYRTSNARHRGLGHGWTHPACETLQVGNDVVIYEDAEGRRIEFPLPQNGQFTTNSAEGLFLHRDWHTVFYLKQPGQPDKLFIGRNTLKLHALIDTVGNRWDFYYDDQHNALQRMTSSWGDHLQVDIDHIGQLCAIRQFLPDHAEPHTLVRYHYDDQRDLIAVEDAGGDAETFAYHNHIITRRTLRTGFSFYFEWDQYTPQAKCLRQYGDDLGDGAIYDYHFEWDTANRISRSRDSNGGVREVHYNEQGRLTREIDPAGNETRFEYDAAGRLSKKIDALGFEHQYYYDDIGNLTAQLDPAGGGFNLLYDDDFRLIEYSDALGNTWAREYNDKGLVSKTIDADGNETRYFYNDRGQPEIIIDPTGQKRLLQWAPNGKLLRQVHEQGEPVSYEYDSAGHISAVEQGGRTTRYRYNRKGDITAIHYHDGSAAQLHYNANRQLTTYTDPLGRTTRFEYDGLAQIVRRIDAAGNTLHYRYDRERNLIGLINEKGEHYQLRYDANERLIAEIGFDGRVQQYQYNPLGQLIAHIEGHYDIDGAPNADERARRQQQQDANTTRFERDPLGRLLQKISPDGDSSVFTYDRNGRLQSAINRARSLAFEYTASGQLRAEIQDQARIEHQYDALGHRIGTTLPGGQQLEFEYSRQGLFTALDLNGQRITQLERNSLGQEVFRTQGTLFSGFDYDPAGRLTRQWAQHHNTQHAVIDRRYHYDDAGRLHGIDDLRKGPTRYIYDQIDRLKAVEGYASEQFEFDPAGNILSGNAQAPREQASNVGAGNRLRFHGDRHFHYDERGNLIEERRGKNGAIVTRYQYNKQNQLVRVEKDGQTFDYTYDPLGRRVRKQDAFGTTEFLWNGDVLLCEQRNHAQKLYLYEPGSFRPLAFVERNQVYFYHLDHLGTPQEMTDWEGRVVWSARYRVYGNVLKQDVEAVENNLRFQGQYFDAETGLHYNRFRYYDPGTGQFTQQDPVGLLGGINNYRYAPNPTGWVDPLGLVCKERYDRYKAFRAQGLSAEDAAKLSKTKTDFYVGPSGPESTLPATGYRYMGYEKANGTVDKYAQQAIDTRKARLSYFGFEKLDTGDNVTEAFQIRAPKHVTPADPDPAWSDGRLRIEFNTLQLYENGVPKVAVPYSHGGKGADLEPFTNAYPKYGTGGAQQLVPKGTVEIIADKVDILPAK
ncbi:MAG: RHS repeat-associated core domain-containing protein [Gammaproteobacteria bacterium]